MSGYRMGCVVVMLGALLAGSGTMQAQSENAPGCTLEKQIYTCDWAAFVPRLNKAKTVAIETERLDHNTAKQLRELAGELGKSDVTQEQQGDLTFLLIPLQPAGVNIGPEGEPLATLRIYGPLPGNPRGTLLWAENYTGQPDKPWPLTVHALIEQFRDRVHRH